MGMVFHVTVLADHDDVIRLSFDAFVPTCPTEVTAPVPPVGPDARSVRKAPSIVVPVDIPERSNFITPRALFTPPDVPGWQNAEKWVAVL